MKKKTMIVAAIAATLMCASCTKEKEYVNDISSPESESGIAKITAHADFLPANEGKAAPYTAMEARDLKIDKYHISFCKNGRVVKEVSVNNAGITDGRIPSTEVRLPVGEYQVYVAANAYTDLSELTVLDENGGGNMPAYDEFKSPESFFWPIANDAYTSAGTLVHTGAGSVTVTSGTEATSASTGTIELKRRVARIRVNSIRNNLPSGIDVELEAVYLANFTSRDLLFLDYDYASAKKWLYIGNPNGRIYNENGETGMMEEWVIGQCDWNEDDCDFRVAFSEIATQVLQSRVEKGAVYSRPFNLYCYRSLGGAATIQSGDYMPQPFEYDCLWQSASSALPGPLLVVAVGIGTGFDLADASRTMVYYPVKLSEVFPAGIKANHSYVLDIELNDIGTSDPSQPRVHSMAEVSARVSDWNDGGASTVEI